MADLIKSIEDTPVHIHPHIIGVSGEMTAMKPNDTDLPDKALDDILEELKI